MMNYDKWILRTYNKQMLDCMDTEYQRQGTLSFQFNLFVFVGFFCFCFWLVWGFLKIYLLNKLPNIIVIYREIDSLPFYELKE